MEHSPTKWSSDQASEIVIKKETLLKHPKDQYNEH